MPIFLDSSDADFEARFSALLNMKREDSPDVDEAVAAIIADVRARGDAAVIDLTERFDRVDSHRSREMGGTGLGLAIVKHIVNRHRGRLRIRSEKGKGSTFTVVLPK